MKLTVLNNHQAIAIQAAKELSEAIKNKAHKGESFVLGLATGSTMEPLYAELVRMHTEEHLDFSHVIFFNLDNYVGLAQDDRNNYDEQLHKLFLRKINANPINIHLVQSAVDFNHQAYEEKIKAAGGIDIQLLGIGRNGHIGFNEVGSSIHCMTRQIELSQETREDNGKFFNQINKETAKMETIPLFAHTRGIAPILEAKTILCLANGHAKADAIQQMCQNGSIEELPVRALHHHSNVITLVDHDTLALFHDSELTEHTNLTEAQKRTVLIANQSHPVNLDIKGIPYKILLPPNFDFYNPKTMDINEPFDYQNERHLGYLAACLETTAHISVGAHPDDSEIMAGPIMLKEANSWLTLILTNGAATNNTLNGKYSECTAEELTQMRQKEQRQAAMLAGVPLIMCKFPTSAITGDMGSNVLTNTRETISNLFDAMKNLKFVYGHNPLDSHDTHINTFAEQVTALRTLTDERLKDIKIWGMEVWGTLHIPQQRLLKIPVENEDLLRQWRQMISVYQSQIQGQGRDYATATINRACGNAGYQTHPHGANPPEGLLLAVDLTDLVQNKSLSIIDMVHTLMSELSQQTISNTQRVLKDRQANKRKNSQLSSSSSSFFPCSEEIERRQKFVKKEEEVATAYNFGLGDGVDMNA